MMIEHCDRCRVEIPKEEHIKGKFDAIFFKKKNNKICFYSFCPMCLMELENWILPEPVVAKKVEHTMGDDEP